MLLSAAFWAGGPALIDLMAKDAAVRAEGRAFLPWVVALPVLSVGAYMLDGIFIGATATRAMRNAMLASVAVYALVLGAAVPAFGNSGLWIALTVLNLVRTATLLAAYPGIERQARAG
jgi:MATE family multidrug resistance protein